MRIPNAISILIILLAGAAGAAAQSGVIAGTIRDESGGPVVGATVQILGTRLGAVSRSDGAFTIESVPVGSYTVTARGIGYRPFTASVTVQANERTTLAVVLASAPVEFDQIEVHAEGKRQLQSDTRPSLTKIEPREAKYLPGAAEDVMRSLRTLPGVIAPSDFSSQLVVRGSGPDQNLIIIDDIEILNPYRLYGFVSMFNPETISDITLLTGGFPSKYGDRLSAVLDVTNREGGAHGAPLTGKLNASVTNANVVLEGELPSALNGGWLLSGRRTYYDLILGPIARSAKLVDGDVAFPNFRDLQFKAVVSPWASNSFVINAITSRDATELVSGADRPGIDSISINDHSTNTVAGLAWRFTPSANFLSKTIASWYQNTGETEFGGEGGSRLLYGDVSRDSVAAMIRALPASVQDSLRKFGITAENPPALGISDGNAGFTFEKYSLHNETNVKAGSHLMEFGAGIDAMHTAILFNAKPDTLLKALRAAQRRVAFPDSIVSEIDYYRANAYVQDKIAVSDRLNLQGGVRLDYYRIIDRAYAAPRLSASYALDPLTTLRAAFGVYYQSPGYEKLLDRSTYFDLTSPMISQLRAEQSMHYVLGIDRMLDDEWQVRAEGYYKTFDDLIVQQKLTGTKYISTPLPDADHLRASGWSRPVGTTGDSLTPIPVNGATGAAYGVEILVQKLGTTKDSKWSGWLGYTLAWANRYRDGVTFPFDFDQRHTVNLVLAYKAAGWLELGASMQYGSGFPYTPPTGFGPIVVMNTDSAGAKEPAVATNVFGEVLFSIDRGGVANINSARLPSYQRLDLRATAYADWWDLKWAIYLDVINVLNHKNVLTRSFSVDKKTGTLTQRDVGMLPILPTLGLSIAF